MQEQLINRIDDVEPVICPFPHFVIENFFPADVCDQITEFMPPDFLFEKSDPRKTTNKQSLMYRKRMSLDSEKLENLDTEQKRIWSSVATALGKSAFSDAVKNCFRQQLEKRYGTCDISTRARLELIRDQEGYSIKPHSDARHKAITLLCYLAKDNRQLDLGTSLFTPKTPGFTEETGRQLPFELFDEVLRVPYKPNTVLGFMKTENSFHGRYPIEALIGHRDWINCSIQHDGNGHQGNA